MVMLSDSQQQALLKLIEFLAGDTQEFILTGAAGTGKTFLIDLLREDYRDILFTATTNKAASLVSPSMTIHSFLGLQLIKDYKTNKEYLSQKRASKRIGILVIDEASMIDKQLYGYIRSYLDSNRKGKVIYLGDSYQLLSVKGNFNIFDMNIPKAELVENVRCDKSNIDELNRLRRCIAFGKEYIPEETSTIQFLNEDDMKAKVLEYVLDDPSNNRCLAYTNNTVQAYNQFIREHAVLHSLMGDNPLDMEFPSVGEVVITNKPFNAFGNIIPSETLLHVNNKINNLYDAKVGYPHVATYMLIMSLVGNKSFNTVYKHIPKNIKHLTNLKKELRYNEEYQQLKLIDDEFIDIRPVYAQTCHKAQGSTYKNVFLDLVDINTCRNLDTRNRLLYVALSRATDNIYIYNG